MHLRHGRITYCPAFLTRAELRTSNYLDTNNIPKSTKTHIPGFSIWDKDGKNALLKPNIWANFTRQMAQITDRRKKRIQEVLQKRQRDLTLIMDNIHDPHNVSAILRSCDAFGVYKIHLYYTWEESPEMGRKSSASAMKWVERENHDHPETMFTKLKDRGCKILATVDAEDSLPLTEWDMSESVAVILGNEHSGISPELMPYIDGKIYIPMQGMVESLNVSVAAAVILYEGWRQREKQGMYNTPDFSSKELEDLYRQWYKK